VKAMVEALSEGRVDDAKSCFDTVKNGVATDGAAHLLALLPAVLDKYMILGGFEFIGTMLPANFYHEQAMQPVPPELMQHEEGSAVSLRYVLARAKQMQYVMEEGLIAPIVDELMLLGHAPVHHIRTVVGSVLAAHELSQVVAEHKAVSIEHTVSVEGRTKEDGTYSSKEVLISGTYTYRGFFNGRPCYQKAGMLAGGECFLYFYAPKQQWFVSTELGAPTCLLKVLSDALDFPSAEDSADWAYNTGQKLTVAPHITKASDRCSLQDSVTAFLEMRKHEDAVERDLLTLAHIFELKIGPPKSLARAMDKVESKGLAAGPASLKDLNRCTFLFDSPVILALTYALLEHRVKQLGGVFERSTNYFFADGNVCADFDRPPCVHIVVRVHGWLFEIMLTFSDVALFKKELHKFYDVTRANDFFELLA